MVDISSGRTCLMKIQLGRTLRSFQISISILEDDNFQGGKICYQNDSMAVDTSKKKKKNEVKEEGK